MTTCVPITAMKDTSTFASMVEASDAPIIVTKNGVQRLVVMTVKHFDEMEKSSRGQGRLRDNALACEGVPVSRAPQGGVASRSRRSAAGCLSFGANPSLIEEEPDAWARAAREKHGRA